MLNINLEWDANAAQAPQSFRDGVQAAANILEAAIYDPITVNIEVGYGEYDLGGPQYYPLTLGFSLGGYVPTVTLSYPALWDALAAKESNASDVESINALPNVASLDGQTTFNISTAQAKAFGAISATDPAMDGNIGFPTIYSGSPLVNLAIVEELHAIGLYNANGDLGLFSYTSPASHFLPARTTAATPAYFSLDGGWTDLAGYNVRNDETLFAGTRDTLNFPSFGNTALTSLDLAEISAIGFDDTSTPVLAPPELVPAITAPGTSAVLGTQNVSVARDGSALASSMLTYVSVPVGTTIEYYGFKDGGGGTGHLAFNGVAEQDNQWVYVLDTQLDALAYVGGTAPGSEAVSVAAFGAAGMVQSAVLTATTTSVRAPALLGEYDSTNGQSAAVWMDPAGAGGPGYIQNQFIYGGADNLSLSTAVPNAFVRSGSGFDAIQVASGQNVLDGGLGSNFLTGGTGTDTFFTDARAPGVVWNTIQNFHAGDAATLWGFVPGVSSYSWDPQPAGAPGFEGATLRANIVGGSGRTGNGVDASITFTGLSAKQASELQIVTGTQPAGQYLYIYNPGV